VTKFDHAIVLGGSIAGLFAACALTRTFRRVTIVDRDELPLEGPEARRQRRGVPQGDQIHHMLNLGSEKIEDLLPGLHDELLELGCEEYDDTADFAQWAGGAWRMRVRSTLRITAFRRPLFEWAVRRRVLALPNVTVVKGMAVGLAASSDGESVIGAKVRGTGPGTIEGDLVIDATGRGSRSPNWLEDLGYERPLEKHLRIYMGYSTFTARFPNGVLPKGLAGIMITGNPSVPRGGSIRPCGNGLHDVVAYGMTGNYPPDDLDSLRTFFADLENPIIAEYLRRAEILSEVSPYQMPGNQRRMWEELERRPAGFIALGDSVTSFNPRYGQGMTMAALGAAVLAEKLDDADAIPGLASGVQKSIGPWADLAFELAYGLDSAYPEAEYENLEPPSARDLARARAFTAAQTEEAHVLVAARSAALYMDSSFAKAADVQRTIDEWAASDRRPDPGTTDPLDPPGITEA
jgi:2-polyprenyl-6-methoxyphenol hydroxylase-like FAD-dependent oxidoreductase